MEVKSVEKLVSSLLQGEKEFVSSQCKPLLANGENYGSIMVDLKVTLKEKDGKEEDVMCVAKTCPPKGILWSIFNTEATFKKEIALYETVVPTLNNFGKEKGIEVIMPFFAQCYGARISLDLNSNEVDSDAVLLLENVKYRGFQLSDRFVGFNAEETKLVLRNLAVFHAVPLAHKLEKPEEFKEKILPYLKREFKFHPPLGMVTNITSLLREVASSSPKVANVFPKIQENFRKFLERATVSSPEIREPFATMVHNDFWVNNTMLRFENGTPVENIMVDFQGIDYNSPAYDLVFFLYTSVELSLLEATFDELVAYYFKNLIDTLEKLGCQTKQFTFQKFEEEMAIIARDFELFHISMMLQPVYMKKEEARDLSKMDEMMVSSTKATFHENFHKKALFIMSDFVNRGWV